MRIHGAALTNTGLARSTNEDCIVFENRHEAVSMTHPRSFSCELTRNCVLTVADGMGGHNAGEQASQYASTWLSERLNLAKSERDIEVLLKAVNRQLYEMASTDRAMLGMGTTIAGILVSQDRVMWFNVGDSKVFRFRNNYLRQLSIDDVPIITVAKQSTHTITQALGGARSFVEIDPHVGSEPVVAGWRYLLCSDGLTDVLSVEAIERAMLDDDFVALGTLLGLVVEAGAPDNISAIAVTIDGNAK